MSYQLSINQTLRFSTLDEARELGQFVDYLTRDKDKTGGIRLNEVDNGRRTEISLYKPEQSRATNLRQECHTTVLSVIKNLSEKMDTQFNVSELSRDVVILTEGTSLYTIDYKRLYQNFSEVAGQDNAETFKTAVSETLVSQSLRGIKGIKL